MKNIKLIYSMLLLAVIALASSCEDYYSVDVGGDPGVKPNVVITPEGTVTLPAKEAATEIEIVTNMDPSTISIALPEEGKQWCEATLNGTKVSLKLADNPLQVSRSTELTIKVFSVTNKVEIVQEAKAPEPIYPIEGVYKFDIPAPDAFEATKMYKVMDGKTKVAEICMEYLNGDNISSRAVVVYAGQGDGGDYTRGMVAYLVDAEGNQSATAENGGIVAFNYADNTLLYEPGTSEAVRTVYLSGFGISTEEQADAKDASAEPYTVSDMDGNTYPVVKVGTEVWLGSNLRSSQLADGTKIPEMAVATMQKTEPGFLYPNNDSSVDPSYGYLYTAKVFAQADLLAGSITDGIWRVSTGGGDNGSGVIGTGTDWQRLFKYIGKDQLGALLVPGYEWRTGGANGIDPATITNITGLSILPVGEVYDGSFVLGYPTQAFFFYGSEGYGYNLAEVDGKTPDQAGVRVWPHGTDACSVRLVRVDKQP